MIQLKMRGLDCLGGLADGIHGVHKGFGASVTSYIQAEIRRPCYKLYGGVTAHGKSNMI